MQCPRLKTCAKTERSRNTKICQTVKIESLSLVSRVTRALINKMGGYPPSLGNNSIFSKLGRSLIT